MPKRAATSLAWLLDSAIARIAILSGGHGHFAGASTLAASGAPTSGPLVGARE